MAYTIRRAEDGRELGKRETFSDAERMALYLTSGYGPLEVLDPQGAVVATATITGPRKDRGPAYSSLMI